jgi:hypothetical protein
MKLERAKGFEAAQYFQPIPSGNGVFIHTLTDYHTRHCLARAKTCEDSRTIFFMHSHENDRVLSKNSGPFVLRAARQS